MQLVKMNKRLFIYVSSSPPELSVSFLLLLTPSPFSALVGIKNVGVVLDVLLIIFTLSIDKFPFLVWFAPWLCKLLKIGVRTKSSSRKKGGEGGGGGRRRPWSSNRVTVEAREHDCKGEEGVEQTSNEVGLGGSKEQPIGSMGG